MDSLNHPKVKVLTREIASGLGLDATLIDFVFAKTRPSYFDYRVEDPSAGWTCYLPEDTEVAYPLWSSNADQTLVIVSDGELAFARGWHDASDIEMLSKTSQGMLAHLMNALLESDLGLDDLRIAASACGFKYLDRVTEFNNRDFERQSWHDAFEQLIFEIDTHSSQ